MSGLSSHCAIGTRLLLSFRDLVAHIGFGWCHPDVANAIAAECLKVVNNKHPGARTYPLPEARARRTHDEMLPPRSRHACMQ